jgi:arylsulfatase A-like enzyme
MFRGGKNTNWEGGYRVPTLIRWPGTIKPGTIINDICAHEDMMPTLLAAAGEPEIVDELLKGKTIFLSPPLEPLTADAGSSATPEGALEPISDLKLGVCARNIPTPAK